MANVTSIRKTTQAPLTAAQFAKGTRPRKGVCQSILEPWHGEIQQLVDARYTLEQIRQFLAANQVEITINGISMFLTRKKRKALRAQRTEIAATVATPAAYPLPNTRTLKCTLDPAEICRRNGWGPGTLLAGKDRQGVTVIRITAVGDTCILAREICCAGKPANDIGGRELNWTLEMRDWREVSPVKVAAA